MCIWDTTADRIVCITVCVFIFVAYAIYFVLVSPFQNVLLLIWCTEHTTVWYISVSDHNDAVKKSYHVADSDNEEFCDSIDDPTTGKVCWRISLHNVENVQILFLFWKWAAQLQLWHIDMISCFSNKILSTSQIQSGGSTSTLGKEHELWFESSSARKAEDRSLRVNSCHEEPHKCVRGKDTWSTL